ncbi:MAG: hypothetical protein [Microviridae sp.]|nr:MAG: hypothetical protein [Microviridae sp.]
MRQTSCEQHRSLDKRSDANDNEAPQHNEHTQWLNHPKTQHKPPTFSATTTNNDCNQQSQHISQHCEERQTLRATLRSKQSTTVNCKNTQTSLTNLQATNETTFTTQR